MNDIKLNVAGHEVNTLLAALKSYDKKLEAEQLHMPSRGDDDDDAWKANYEARKHIMFFLRRIELELADDVDD